MKNFIKSSVGSVQWLLHAARTDKALTPSPAPLHNPGPPSAVGEVSELAVAGFRVLYYRVTHRWSCPDRKIGQPCGYTLYPH